MSHYNSIKVLDKDAASDSNLVQHLNRFQKSVPVCRPIDEKQPVTEESEPAAEPPEALEEVTAPRDDCRVRILFERCLIACALYEEFWTRVRTFKLMPRTQWSHPNSVLCVSVLHTYFVCVQYTQYLESQNVEEARAIFKRACEIHLMRRPNIYMQWATFEERHGMTKHSVHTHSHTHTRPGTGSIGNAFCRQSLLRLGCISEYISHLS